MTQDPGERKLLERAAQADREAFGELALRHQSRVRGYVSRFVADSEEGFDLSQNVFLEAYRSLSMFDLGLEFFPWLRGIALNLVRESLRAGSRLRARELRVFEDTLRRWKAECIGREEGAEDRLGLLRDCVEGLDPDSRALVEKRYFEGLEMDAVAVWAKKRAGALSMQFLRIRAALAQCVRAKLETAR